MSSRQELLQLMGDHAKALHIGRGHKVESLPFLEVLAERIQKIERPDKFVFSGLELNISLNGLVIKELDEKHSISIGEIKRKDGFLIAYYGREPKSKRPFIKFMIYGRIRAFADGQNFFAQDLRQKDLFQQLKPDAQARVLNWTSCAITRKIEAERIEAEKKDV